MIVEFGSESFIGELTRVFLNTLVSFQLKILAVEAICLVSILIIWIVCNPLAQIWSLAHLY